MRYLYFFLFLLIPICSNAQLTNSKISIIPKPAVIEQQKGEFELKSTAKILVENAELANSSVTKQLQELLNTATWFDLPVVNSASAQDTVISLKLVPESEITHPEAYTLAVTPSKIEIQASAEHGLFYGLQSLRQLLPPEIEFKDRSFLPRDPVWKIPAVNISDEPRFEYRGMHLDMARHFQNVDFVKKYIDLIAMHKMNRFHWHLTDDQGWRIEIKKYPKLTEIGAWRDSTSIGRKVGDDATYDNIKRGGYYTQEEIREVVQYAKDRFITIIPEVELPGHASAALASYPEFGCFEKEYKVISTFGVFEDIFCPKEETFEFLEDVFDEVMDLFPGEYIHIGGDEVPMVQWEKSDIAQEVMKREGLKKEIELHGYFITRIEQYLNSKGRQIIGWDEIMDGGLAPRATVMSWREEVGGIKAAKMGHYAIMTPWSTNYFDHYQADTKTEPLAIGGFTTVEEVYAYDPIPEELRGTKEEKYILGSQGNVWTEYMHTPEKVEYMAFPKIPALSEGLWSPKESKDWYGFWGRLQNHFKRLDNLGVNYAKHYQGKMGN